MEPQYIFGKHPIAELLKDDPKRVSKLYIAESVEAHDLVALAKEHKITVVTAVKTKLDELTQGAIHQGVVALVQASAFIDLKDWLSKRDKNKNELVVVLDEVEDPHNVGAIIRSSAAGGASAVLFGAHRQAPITGTVWKASAGTAGKIALIEVRNTNDAIRKLKDAGFWVASLAMEGDTGLFDAKLDGSFAIIVGGEGKGVREKTGELADMTISIPMTSTVESLNASVAAALLIYEWKRKN